MLKHINSNLHIDMLMYMFLDLNFSVFSLTISYKILTILDLPKSLP